VQCHHQEFVSTNSYQRLCRCTAANKSTSTTYTTHAHAHTRACISASLRRQSGASGPGSASRGGGPALSAAAEPERRRSASPDSATPPGRGAAPAGCPAPGCRHIHRPRSPLSIQPLPSLRTAMGAVLEPGPRRAHASCSRVPGGLAARGGSRLGGGAAPSLRTPCAQNMPGWWGSRWRRWW
jgi:hypothetical protein